MHITKCIAIKDFTYFQVIYCLLLFCFHKKTRMLYIRDYFVSRTYTPREKRRACEEHLMTSYPAACRWFREQRRQGKNW